MPTWQGAEFLDAVLTSLSQQAYGGDWELLVVDSGSKDETLEIIARHQKDFPVPFALRSIHNVEFDHGDTRNYMAALGSGELCVFLTQDAIPAGKDWLETLVANFEDPDVGAAYCRNAPRPDADFLTGIFSADDPGYSLERREVRLADVEDYEELDAHAKRLLYNFNDVASCVRRKLWERHPFPRTWFGEDVLMARAFLEAGFTVVYDVDAAVEHSHDYTVDETHKRAVIDGRFNKEWLGRICVESASDAKTLEQRFRDADRKAIEEKLGSGAQATEVEAYAKQAQALRLAAFQGLQEGGAGVTSDTLLPATGMLESKQLRLLYVVHGFPPDTWAGTEIYTLNLAKEMQKLGHQVTILARVPGPGGEGSHFQEGEPEDFSVEQTEFEGLRLLRMTHRLHHQSLEQSFAHPRSEAAFRKVLLSEAPDLVHFQHLIHTSAGLVHVAKNFGCATVVHCHDYWALCSRVQLLRPDGKICEGNMGAGCFLCIKDKKLDRIDAISKAGKLGEKLIKVAVGGANLLGGSRAKVLVKEYKELRNREHFVPAAYAAADLQISPSRFLRERLLASGKFDPHSFLYLDNGMRTDHVEALQKQPSDVVRFGFVGSLVWYKGDEVLVRAMAELGPDVRAELNVYGTFDPEGDEHHKKLVELADATGAKVNFKGRFDNSKLSEVYAEIDVLVVPSVWFENAPITIHEAYLTHTPVVASGIGGMAEYVRDGVDGLHFQVGDPKDLARVLKRFVDEPGLVEELSKDWMEIKTIQENALETEFRYRGLVSRKRSKQAAIVFDAVAIEATKRKGPMEQQGADMLIMRPGSAVDFNLANVPGGVYQLTIEIFMLGGEPEIEHGGHVSLDGDLVGHIEVMSTKGEDETRVVEMEMNVPSQSGKKRGKARVLRIHTAIAPAGSYGGNKVPEAFLRLARLYVKSQASEA
ncbi:MAG: glycosyltransferase involved in cell wall biosynthesis [Planctomycetota bacterium]|jgi:glycosyltransferase involved in cell wall biosynthesis